LIRVNAIGVTAHDRKFILAFINQPASVIDPENTMKLAFSTLVLSAGLLATSLASAQVPADLQAKVDAAKVTLADLAKNPAILAAVKEANGKGGMIAGMTNGKWDEIAESDAQVTGISATPASKALAAFSAKHADLNKLYLRDEKGNLVAAGSGGKPLLWNISTRPFFKPVMEGKAWSDSAVKPDASTQVKGVLFAVPVMDGGKAIGLLQSNYTAK
jgi:hypothetical protein